MTKNKKKKNKKNKKINTKKSKKSSDWRTWMELERNKERLDNKAKIYGGYLFHGL